MIVNPGPMKSAHASSTRLRHKLAVILGLIGLIVGVVSPSYAATEPAAPGADEINGLVWDDRNKDGVNDADEVAFPGAIVTLIDEATGTAVATVTTGADGLYSFPGLTGGPYTVQVETDPAVYPTPSNFLPSLAGPDQDVSQSAGDTRIGVATGVVPGSTINAAWAPRPELSVGSVAVVDGTPAFDLGGHGCGTATDEADAGYDCGPGNNQVRTQDVVATEWSVTASNFEDKNHAEGPVVFEQTLYPADGAKVSFNSIPAACKSANNGGFDVPPSEIIDNPDGTVTLRCNLGEYTEGGQKQFSTVIDVSNASPNGSTFTSDARVYMPDVNNLDIDRAKPATSDPVGPIKISSSPAYDANKTGNTTRTTTMDIDRNGDGDTDDPGEKGVQGMYMTYFLNIAQDRKNGIEQIVQPITLGDAVTAIDSNGNPLGNFEYYIIQCRPSAGYGGDHPYGKIGGNATALNSVIDSGTCSYNRANPGDTDSAYQLTIDGADLSGDSFPVTSATGGVDYANGPFYVISHQIRVFVPLEVIDAENGPVDGSGEIKIMNHFTDFDPDGLSGTSNYNDGVEPGYCDSDLNCEPMPDPDPQSNNTEEATMTLTTRGSFSKMLRDTTNVHGTSNAYLPGQTSWHSGDSEVEPSEGLHSLLYFHNNGTNPLLNPEVCDVFDNTVFQLSESSAVSSNGPAGKYAYVGRYNLVGYDSTWPDNFKVEYAVADLSGDDPLSGGAVDPSTGRYEGTWTAQAAASAQCGDASTTWYDDPTSAPGGIDAVNMVRISPVDPNFSLDGGYIIRGIVPLTVRDTFHGGPHDGELIPVGTVLANYGNRSWIRPNGSRNWLTPSYLPSPENSRSSGDRTTLSRVKIRLTKESLEPQAGYQSSSSTLAGNQIVWQVNTSVQSSLATASPAADVVIIDELPEEVSYNASCTANYPGGTPADIVKPNTNRNDQPETGKTLLIWYMGDLPANQPVPPRIICTDSDPLVANNTPAVNYSEIRASNVVTPLQSRSDEHTINLEQLGSIKTSKRVDRSLDPTSDGQVYTVAFSNFSSTSATAKPVVIDVFPWNGDGQGSLNERDPASNFSGTVTLADVPTTAWTDDSVPGAGEDAMGVFWYTADDPSTVNYNPDENTSTWCSYDGTSFTMEVDNGGTCPATLADATAFRFNSNYDLAPDGNARQGMKITVTLDAQDNAAGDFYANRFGFDSATLPDDQFLRSNTVTVQVEGYELGDLIFVDTDNDGKYTEGTDIAGPEGLPVEVYLDDDGTTGPSAGDTLVKTVTTNENGRWRADKLAAGDYYARIPAAEFAAGGKLAGYKVQPEGYEADPNTDVNDPTGDHHASTPGDEAVDGVVTPVITLSSTPGAGNLDPATGNEPLGDNTGGLSPSVNDDFTNYTLDMAFTTSASLGDRVWVDEDGDGVQDATEPGLGGATITATWYGWDGVPGGDDDVVYTTTTDSDGNYKFENLPPGEFKVEVSDVTSDLKATYDLDGTPDASTTVTLAPAQDRTDVDFGYRPSFTLGNRVWVDMNGDGKYDAGDSPVPAGTELVLMNADGTPTGLTTTTDANGNYQFTDLVAGHYYVVIPASAFVDALARAEIAPDGETYANNNEDETDDHNATATLSDGGIRSALISLSATYSDTPGAQATGDEPDGFTNNTLDLALKIDPVEPAIELVKSVQRDDANTAPGVMVAAGENVVWMFKVTNTGNVDLTDVSVSDPTLDAANVTILCPTDTLAVGSSMYCTASQLAATAGPQTNTASASGTGPETIELDGTTTPGETVTDDDPANYFGAEPAIQLVKSVQGDDANDVPGVLVAVGEDVVWTFTVTNTGNVDLTDVSVTDTSLPAGATITCDANTLAVGASTNCTSTAVPATAGQQTNTATASGTGPETVDANGNTVPGKKVTDDDLANYFGAEPGIEIIKSVQGDDANAEPGVLVAVGEDVVWTFEVKNTGNVPLSNVLVSDQTLTDAGATITCPQDTLAVGKSMECTASPVAAVAGQQTNNATASGTGPETVDSNGEPVPGVTVTDDDTANYFGAEPAIEIIKSVQGDDANAEPGVLVAVGEDVVWTFEVKNTGNVDLTDVSVSDPKLTAAGATITCDADTLAVGESTNCTSTAVPATAGQQTNTATASGTGPETLDSNGEPVPGKKVTDDDPANYFGSEPAIELTKLVQQQDANDSPGMLVPIGQDVVWTFEVKNTGNVDLTDVSVSDPTLTALGATITCDADTLAVGESTKCTSTAVAATAGQTTNTATASGTGPETVDTNGEPVPGKTVTDDDPANYFGAEPAIEIIKSVQGDDANAAPGALVAQGQDVVWTFEVKNTGNVPLSNVSVSDPTLTAAGATIKCPGDALAVGESMVCTSTAVAAVAGQQTNTATATGTGPETLDSNGEPVPGVTVTDDDPANYFGAEPAVDVEKYVVVAGVDHDADAAPGPSLTVGSVASWKIVVTNTGNVPLTDVAVEDPKMAALGAQIKCAGGNPIATLPVGAVAECTVSAKVTEAGVFTNTASASGTPPQMIGAAGSPFTPDKVSDSDPANYNGQKLIRPTLPPETGAAGTQLPVTGLAVLAAVGSVLLGLRRRTS